MKTDLKDDLIEWLGSECPTGTETADLSHDFAKKLRERLDEIAELKTGKEPDSQYHLECEKCGNTFWSINGFPKPQLCDNCKKELDKELTAEEIIKNAGKFPYDKLNDVYASQHESKPTDEENKVKFLINDVCKWEYSPGYDSLEKTLIDKYFVRFKFNQKEG